MTSCFTLPTLPVLHFHQDLHPKALPYILSSVPSLRFESKIAQPSLTMGKCFPFFTVFQHLNLNLKFPSLPVLYLPAYHPSALNCSCLATTSLNQSLSDGFHFHNLMSNYANLNPSRPWLPNTTLWSFWFIWLGNLQQYFLLFLLFWRSNRISVAALSLCHSFDFASCLSCWSLVGICGYM